MKYIFLILYTITFFTFGSNTQFFAQTNSLKNIDNLLAENTVNPDKYHKSNCVMLEENVTESKQNNLYSMETGKHLPTETDDSQNISFELAFFLLMVVLTSFLAIINIYGRNGESENFQQIDDHC